jgi:predicted Zn-dependent protease
MERFSDAYAFNLSDYPNLIIDFHNMLGIAIFSIFSDSNVAIMQPLNILSVNQDPDNSDDPVKFVENAGRFFPKDTWYDIRYLGELSLEHDLEIKIGEEVCGALLFKRLLKRFRALRETRKLIGILLGLTLQPIVDFYHFLEEGKLKSTVFFVHDYVSQNVGVVSLFRVEKDSACKVVAHGLGHNQGLRHHLEPTDLMHSELLQISKLQVEGFCSYCLDSLSKRQKQTRRA